MSLPDESLEAAEEITAAWDDDPSRHIYDHLEDQDYGLTGALDRGLNVRHLHESDGQRNCYEHAIHAYTLAKHLDLDPRFFEIEEGQTTHAFIDIEQDGERYHIDQGRYGPIKDYSDTELQLKDSPVNDNTQKGYKSISQKHEDELTQDIQDLREDTVAMLARGQRLEKLNAGDTTIYDKLIFHRDDDVLERMISFYEPVGHKNHLLRIRHSIDEEGDLDNTETILADIDSAGWNTTWGEDRIGILDDSLTPADNIPQTVRENIAAVLEYEDRADGDLIYTDDQHQQLWETYRTIIEDQINDSYTGFRGKDMKKELDRLKDLKENDPERFHTELDWMQYLHDTADRSPPDDKTLKEMLPQYIQRHTDVLDHVRDQDHNTAVETVLDNLDSPTRQTDTDIDPEEAIQTIRDHGPGKQYEILADKLQKARDGHEPDMGQEYSLLTAHPQIKDQTTAVLDHLIQQGHDLTDEREAIDDLLPETKHEIEDPYNDVTDTWEIDKEENDLIRTLVLDDGSICTHNAVLELTYDIDPVDPDDTIEVSMYDTPDGHDERLHYGSFTIEDEDEISLETVQDTVLENYDDILEQTPLNAPAPHSDATIFEQNLRAVAIYSIYFRDDDDMPHLFSKDELDEFNQQAREEAEIVLASPFTSHEEKEKAREEIAIVTDMFDDDWQHYAVAQHNKLESLRTTDHETFEELIHDSFGPREMAQEYAKKFYDIANDHVTQDDAIQQAQEIQDRAQDGIQQGLPGPDTITELADQNSLDPLEAITATVESPGPSWEQKTTAIRDDLDTLTDRLDDIETEQEKQYLNDALTAIEARITSRQRYQDHDDSLETDFKEARARIQDHTPFQDMSDELDTDEMTAVLEQLA